MKKNKIDKERMNQILYELLEFWYDAHVDGGIFTLKELRDFERFVERALKG